MRGELTMKNAGFPPKIDPRLRLVLYSGGQQRSNQRLHREVARLAEIRRSEKGGPGRRRPLTLTYIPYMAEGSETYFARAMRRYSAAGIERYFILAPDTRPTGAELEVLLTSDVIYLAGGNTYEFLALLRRSGLINPLRRFAREGGELAGLSAGAILMTPTIGLAGVPRFDADENTPHLRDLSALGLLSFEFSPHEADSATRRKQLLDYSRTNAAPILAVRDGGGVVIEQGDIKILGSARIYRNGERWTLP
jgi:dipeptidase E